MMSLLINFALVTLAIAAPLAELDRRQTTSVEKEFSNGPCRDIIFFFARGSTEVANMESAGLLIPSSSN